MKIIAEDANCLHVAHRPWLVGGIMWLMGMVALYAAVFNAGELNGYGERFLVGLLGVAVSTAAWWFAPTVDLIFDRQNDSAAFIERRMFHRQRKDFALGAISRARLEANWSDGARLTRLALDVDGAVVPLETGFTSADREKVEAGINRWLAGEISPTAIPPTQTPNSETTVRRRR